MDIKDLKQLTLHAAKGTAPAEYSNGSVEQAMLDGFKELCGNIYDFRQNKQAIFQIISEVADEIVPRNVISALAPFAEVQVVPQGTKALFHKKAGKMRAKQFLTQVGLSGVYETFRLDKTTFELAGHAVGQGATLDFERVLDGAESMVEVMNIMTECIEDSVYLLVHKALRAAINAKGRPTANKVSISGFNGDMMAKLIAVVRAYGNNAVIFAPPEFVAAMGADAIVPIAKRGTDGVAQGVYSPDDIDSIHRTGYITLFRGTPVVQIPQSFIDENNEKTWIDPQVAYILPTGGEKVVKVVLEGQTIMYDFENRDQSMEIYWYKKMGAAILCHYNWAIYQNLAIPQTYGAFGPYGINE